MAGTASGLQGTAGGERHAFVDYAKGICIILVVMMHSVLGLGDAVGGEGWLHQVVAFAKPFRMPDFFFVSGLFLARVIDRGWPRYLDTKVLHFAYFYLLWTLIQFIVKAPVLSGGSPVEFVRLLALALIEPFGTLWFIYLLAIFFVVTKLLRGVPAPVLLGVAAALEIAHLRFDWTVLTEFGNRYVYFLAGYLFAPAVFAFAGRVASWPAVALGGLAAWALANGTLVKLGWAGLPGVSLVLGGAGALAVVAVAALLAKADILGWLRYCGKHSLVIYLAFFLPMAATRILLVKLGLAGLDIGTASAVITIFGVVVPLVLFWLVRGTKLGFLFERPAWARLERPAPGARMQPAE